VWQAATRARAEYLGLGISRRMVIVLAISGAIAGLAGSIELTGVTNRLQEGISVNYGYSGVLIAFLREAGCSPWASPLFLFAALVSAATRCRRQALPSRSPHHPGTDHRVPARG